MRVNAPQRFFRGFIPAVRDVWAYRELLVNLARKELKVKYKDSVLGFVWSLARPLFLLLVYWIVLGKFLKSGIPNFAFYLFSGLVAWDLFSQTLGASTSSIVGNAGLIKKVYFPREILPLAAIGAALVHFVLQLIVLFSVLLLFRYDFFGSNLLLLPLAVVALVLFMSAVSLLLAAANVYLRDVQHLLEVFLLFWFWMTPIVYPVHQAMNTLERHSLWGVKLSTVYMLNPMTNVVMSFQRGIYKNPTILYAQGFAPYLRRSIAVIIVSCGLLWFAQRVFAKAQGNFAQEL